MKRLLLATTCLLAAAPVYAQSSSMQSPAYVECSTLASTNPTQALVKAEAWLKIDAGIAAQHCRAMALYGLHRFPEAAEALTLVREGIGGENIALRSYVARQAVRAYINASQADKALVMLNGQIVEISNFKGDNANASRLTSELLLDRARLNTTYGKLDDAAKDLDHAVSLTPVNEEVLLERANVFEKLGDIPLAKNDIDAVLTINGGNAQAKAIRDRLNGTQKSQNIAIPSAVVASPAANAEAAPVTSVTETAQPTLVAPAPLTAEPQPVKKKKKSAAKKVTPASEAP